MRVLVKVEPREIEGVMAGIRWISEPPKVSQAFGLPKIKKKVLQYLRGFFPVSEGDYRRKTHLVSGFRAYDTFNVPGQGGSAGFVIQHVNARDPRTRTILASLEYGSRGYYNKKGIGPQGDGYRMFRFQPGDGRGHRHAGSNDYADFAGKKRVHIPARPGMKIMDRTLKFASRLAAEAKPEFFKKLKEKVREQSKKR